MYTVFSLGAGGGEGRKGKEGIDRNPEQEGGKGEEGIWLGGGGGSKKAFVVVVRARRVFAFKAHRGRRRGGGMVLRSTALAWEGGREGVTVQVYNVCEATIISPGEGGSTHKVVFDLI